MDLQSALTSFLPVSLGEMESIRLMNRMDTKFVTTTKHLELLLQYAFGDYRAQEVSGERNIAYHTVYLDTPVCSMYLAHQNGRAVREKIRIRTYVSSQLTFLEVKNKDNRGRTDKKRIRVTDAYSLQTSEVAHFLECHAWYRLPELTLQLENDFQRITLVNNAMTERLTIDTNVCFHHLRTGRIASLNDLVIIELKRDGRTSSPAYEILRSLHVKPLGISKYCIGQVLTSYHLKYNGFKSKIRMFGHIKDSCSIVKTSGCY